MSVKITNSEPFQASRDGIRQLTIVANGGSATLEALAGTTWVVVDDGIVAIDSIITFHAVTGQKFRVVLIGDAEAWIAG